MSYLTVPIVKNSHILAGICFIFLKDLPRRNSKVLQYQIWTSKKRSKKKLPCKTNFSTFLQLSCSNFRLKVCQRPSSNQNCQTNQVGRSLGRVRSKKLLSETTVDKIFEKTLVFIVNWRTTRKNQFLFSRNLLLVLTKFSFWEEHWAPGYNSMKF